MEQQLKSLKAEAIQAFSAAENLNALNELRVEYLGRKKEV